MAVKKRRNFNSSEKFKIVIEAIKGEKTINEIASQYDVHPNMVTRWKKEFMEKGQDVFERSSKAVTTSSTDEDQLLLMLGKKDVEIEFLKKNLKRFQLI